MKIPTRFECGGSTINVERVKKLAGRDGEWVSSKSLIRIVEGPEEAMFETLMHEVTHAIRDRYGHNLEDDHAEECATEGMAQGFCQFIRTAK